MVKLTGFSAAKSADDTNLTRAGTIVGNSTYTAPEVFHGSSGLDPRIDVYAIGCVFYALVTGRPPFVFKSEYEVMMAHIQIPPAPPSTLNPSINAVLDAVILRALEKNPANRYQSAREFYHCILNPGTVYVPPPAPPQPPATPVPAPAAAAALAAVDPEITPAAIALMAGLLFLLVAIWVLLRSTAPTP